MMTAYVVLAIVVGILVAVALASFVSRIEMQCRIDQLEKEDSGRVLNLERRVSVTTEEHEKLKNRIGRLRARVRELEEH